MRSRYLLAIVFLAFFIISAWMWIVPPSENFVLAKSIFFLSSVLFAVVAAFLAIKSYGYNNEHAKNFMWIGAGLVLWFLGEFLWYFFILVLNIDPFPSLADFFYLVAYPLFFIGFYREMKLGKVRWSKAYITIFGIAFLLLAILVGYFGVYMAYDTEASFIENLVAIFYGVGDFFLIVILIHALFVTLEYKGGKIFCSWLFTFVGLAFILTADILFAIYTVPYESMEKPYYYIDLLWIGGYLFWGYGLFCVYSALQWARSRFLKRIK